MTQNTLRWSRVSIHIIKTDEDVEALIMESN